MNFTSNPRIGESFFIECAFEGMPIPSAVWGKDGDELNEMDSNIKIVHTANISRLEVILATIVDNGIYECNISNTAGLTSQSFLIHLQEGQLTHLILYRLYNEFGYGCMVPSLVCN